MPCQQTALQYLFEGSIMSNKVWQFFIQDQEGNVIPDASVTVKLGASNATIYSDKAGATTKANPFVPVDGFAQFYAQSGKYYTIIISAGGQTTILNDVYLGFDDAPVDGKTYAQNNGAWVEIATEINATKESLGLDEVDNTSDANKPISSATQLALNNKQSAISGAASTITDNNLAAGKVAISDSLGKMAASTTDASKLELIQSARSDLQAQIDAVALGTDPLYLGTYISTSIAAAKVLLETAHPTAEAGNWALLDAAGADIVRAAWDNTDSEWIVGSTITNSDSITEGTTNLFLTAAERAKLVGVGSHYATSQNVTVANETEFLAELDKALKATYSSSNVLYNITLPSTINFQINLYNISCRNLNIIIPTGATIDCSSFANNYNSFFKAFILIINCSGVGVSGTATTSNGSGVMAIVSKGSEIRYQYQSQLELQGFGSSSTIENLGDYNFYGSPVISGGCVLVNSKKGSLIAFDSIFSATGEGGILLTGSSNITASVEGDFRINASGYTGTLTLMNGNDTTSLDLSSFSSVVFDSNCVFEKIKINNSGWNELSWTDAQAITPRNGLELFITTYKVKVRGDGTNWVPLHPFIVASEQVSQSNSTTSLVPLKAIEVPFKLLGNKGRMTLKHSIGFSGTPTNANWIQINVNDSTAIGGTNIWLRASGSGLNCIGTKEVNSLTRTSHESCSTGLLAPDAAAASVTFTYDTLTMTHIIYSAACSGLTSDTITLKSVYVEFFPCFN
jgi:hypothetical protein